MRGPFTHISPGQVVGLVVAKLLSTMCVVQGMVGMSLLQKIKTTIYLNEADTASLTCFNDVSVIRRADQEKESSS